MILTVMKGKPENSGKFRLEREFLQIPPGGVLPYKRLVGMCHWMGSYFHDWIDYNRVTFLVG